MSEQAELNLTPPTSAVRNTVGKEKEQTSKNSDWLAFDAALREYCDKYYHQLLPIITEKVHQEKVQTLDARDLRRKLRSRRFRSMSESPERNPSVSRIIRDRSKFPRHRPKGRRDGGVFNRLGDKGKCVCVHLESRSHGYHSRRTDPALKKRYHEGTSLRDMKAFSESEDSKGGHWKSRSKKAKSCIEEEELSQPRCHMFNSTLTGSARVWFDDLPPESIENYDDLKQRERESTEIHHIKQREGESTRLHDNISKLVDGMTRVTTTFLRGEVAASNQAQKKTLPAWKQHEVGRKQNFDRRGDFRNQQRSKRRRHNSEECMHLKGKLGINQEWKIVARDQGAKIRLRLEVKNQMVPATAPSLASMEKSYGQWDKNYGRYDRGSVTHSGTQTKCTWKMLTSQTKENKPCTEKKQINTKGGRKTGGRWHNERSPLSQLVIEPSNGEKHDGSWRMCMDFKDLNNACPKDGYPLPKIDWKVESLCGYPFKCFLDAYKVYHQIKMAKEDGEKTAFSTSQRVFCHSKMPSSLKNDGVTYQHLKKEKARAIRRKSGRYTIINGVLYKKSYLRPWLRKGHTDGILLPNSACECKKDDKEMSRLSEGPDKVKFLIVATDYFTKWIEAKSVAKITSNQIKKFVWDNIVCRFSLPGKIIYDNEKQFRDNPFKDWYEKLCTRQHFASVKYPQANVLVKRANRSLREGIKARLDEKSKDWIKAIPHVLWAHRTMIKSSNRDTSFLLIYRMEVVILAEIGMPSLRTAEIDKVWNDEALEINLDLLEERKEQAAIRKSRSKEKIEKYYNSKVRNTSFKPGDLVYRNNDASHAKDSGKLSPKWEGPYKVTEVLMEAIKKRFGRNTATKKTQRNLMKQQYENFTASNSEMLDQTFDILQKLISQLELLGENISQEYVNQKLLRSLSPEWNTHAMVWRNKSNLDTMSMDDLYNNLKVYEPEVKVMSSSSTSTQNMTFVSSSNNNNTNGAVNTAQAVNTAIRVSTAGTKVNTVNIDNLGNAVICAFMASQPSSPQLSNVECYNFHKRGHFARKCRALRSQDTKLKESTRRTMLVETPASTTLVSCDELDGLDEFANKHVVENYDAKSSETKPKDVKKNTDAPIIKEWVSDDEDEEVTQPKNEQIIAKPSIPMIEFVKPKQPEKKARKTVKQVEKPRPNTHRPRGNQKNWNNMKYQKLGRNMSYLTDYEKINGGYVAFGGNPKGGKITAKVTIRAGKLDFENVYFVRELKFNLFSASQMCDKKNSVLFNDTKCIVLSLNFKLIDESQVLLRVPRKNNMYSVDLKNIVPKGGLTCLFAKATSDESKLWHRRLGHLNFKTMNKLVKGNLVRDHLGKFDGKADEGFFIRYSMNSKAFRVFISRKRIVEENLYIRFSESTHNVAGSRPDWLFDIDALTRPMNYEPIAAGTQSNGFAGTQSNGFAGTKACDNICHARKEKEPVKDYILLPLWTSDLLFSQDPKSSQDVGFQPSSNSGKKVDKDPSKGSECRDQEQDDNVNNTNNVNAASTNKVNAVSKNTNDDEAADMNNMDTTIQVSPVLTTKVHKDHSLDQVIGDLHSTTQTRNMPNNLEEHGKRAIGTKWVFKNKKDERGIVIRNKARLVAQGHTQEEWIDYDEIFAHVARIEAIRLFLAYSSFKDFVVYQMDVKSVFLYGKIKEEVYVCQLPKFEDPDFLDKVYKVKKVLYGLHQAPRAWYETLSTYLLDNGFHRGKIDKTLFIRRYKGDILLVQVYVDDIIFEVKNTSTPMETQKPLLKDEDGEEVDAHMYRSMIGLLMYLTSSKPDIMFAVCACARYQVNPKVSHIHAVKKDFRYLKGQPKFGFWYLKISPFDLVAYTDSDYDGASLDRKSTIEGCKFIRCRLISWQCKKQTMVANSTTEVEYVAASSCYGQVLWIQN
nr:reverse transcriptase domain-containing protein [Tanacetum cinerariifolium]